MNVTRERTAGYMALNTLHRALTGETTSVARGYVCGYDSERDGRDIGNQGRGSPTRYNAYLTFR